MDRVLWFISVIVKVRDVVGSRIDDLVDVLDELIYEKDVVVVNVLRYANQDVKL